jgi:hypothetical protein
MQPSLIVVMRLPQWLANFNRYFTNPIQRIGAGWAPAMGIIAHVGRRSGKEYRVGIRRYQNHPNSHAFATV